MTLGYSVALQHALHLPPSFQFDSFLTAAASHRPTIDIEVPYHRKRKQNDDDDKSEPIYGLRAAILNQRLTKTLPSLIDIQPETCYTAKVIKLRIQPKEATIMKTAIEYIVGCHVSPSAA